MKPAGNKPDIKAKGPQKKTPTFKR